MAHLDLIQKDSYSDTSSYKHTITHKHTYTYTHTHTHTHTHNHAMVYRDTKYVALLCKGERYLKNQFHTIPSTV